MINHQEKSGDFSKISLNDEAINHSLKADDIYFILVEPVYRGNVGAVARVINNFGFSNLYIVGSIPTKEDHYLAVHSQEIMDNIQTFPDLEKALLNMDNAIALSRRSGRKKGVDINVRDIGTFTCSLPRGKTAFVFGRETYGLTDEEANLCPIRCNIAANESFPSLNLAQAVAIVAYELFDKMLNNEANNKVGLSGKNEIDAAVVTIIEYLKQIEYFHTGDDKKTAKQLQNILIKSFTTEENLTFLVKLFHRISILYDKKGETEN